MGATEEVENEIAIPALMESATERDGNSDSEGLAQLNLAIGQSIAEISAVKDQVAELVARDELLAQLHRRLSEQSEEAFARRFTEPLTRKIANIHRRVREQLAYLKGIFEAIPKSVWDQVPQYWSHQALNGIRVDLESILSDFGVDLFVTGSERFDRSVHEAVRKIPTTDLQKVGNIAQRVAPGFRLGDRIIVSERVAVFVKDAAAR
jgi:molecular chaperone GrpE (heat shock protein)